MKIIGITGGIATGKTTVANLLNKLNIKTFNDDVCANDLYKNIEVIKVLKNKFPGIVVENKVDKNLLRKKVLEEDNNNLKELEKIIHPLVEKQRDFFIKSNKGIIGLDSPLLFETNLYKKCNFIILTYCSIETQKSRVAKRNTLNKKQLDFILNKQNQFLESKKNLVNYSICTEQPIDKTFYKLKEILNFINHEK